MSKSIDDQPSIGSMRIKQVFEYLKAINEYRNPAVRQLREQPWSCWIEDLPKHQSIEFPGRSGQVSPLHSAEAKIDPGFILRVRRPLLTACPQPPDELRGWLSSGWDNPRKSAQCVPAQNIMAADGETLTIVFEDEASRVAALEAWLKRRRDWQLAELPARDAMDTFDRFYALHGKLERESEKYDLIIGDGILSWQQSSGSIFHPLLLQRVQLVFDTQRPEFRIVDSDYSSEMNSGLLQTVPGVDPKALMARRDEFQEGGYHPLDPEASGVLQALINQLSSQGAFLGQCRPEASCANPTIGRNAVLFLRSRTKGFGHAIQQVLDGMATRVEFCDALRAIVGCSTASPSQALNSDTPRSTGANNLGGDILFGKATNQEQVRIARDVERRGSVLVQGPPGTGKSHTIANLIGHLLARGESVLVTSHTTKALRVLRNHIVEELRPLCVSVLDDNLDSRHQLEESVRAISSRLSDSDVEELERDAGFLQQERTRLQSRLSDLRHELLTARADEYRDVVFGGSAVSPSEAAQTVANGKGKHDWMPAPVALGAPCPLSDGEATELYASNRSVSADDDRLVDRRLPDPARLPLPDDIARDFCKDRDLADKARIDRRLWPTVDVKGIAPEQIVSLKKDIQSVVNDFSRLSNWELAAVEAGRHGRESDSSWTQLVESIEATLGVAIECQIGILAHDPKVTDWDDLERQLRIVKEIRTHLVDGRKLGWFDLIGRADWKWLLRIWTCRGAKPATADEIASIESILHVAVSRSRLCRLWDGLIAVHGGPSTKDFGGQPENTASQFLFAIREALSWWATRWVPVQKKLTSLGFDWERHLATEPPDLTFPGAIRRTITAAQSGLTKQLETVVNYLESARLKSRLLELDVYLKTFDRPEVQKLRNAVESRSTILYPRAHQELLAAIDKRSTAIARRELIARLRRRHGDGMLVAERWAQAILERAGIHGATELPGDITRAWEWRQLHDELERRAIAHDLDDVGRQIECLQTDLQRATNQLINHRAWAAQLRRTQLEQRQALTGWLGLINRIGRGFGQRVPELRRAAQKQMEQCRTAVPVWIMPLSRLVENFDFSTPRFDVVIVDEASQCDVMAYLALALGRKVVIVGDDKQVSPSAVGQNVAAVTSMIQIHLDGIPNSSLYDGKASIYELARTSLPSLMLQEHFRCVPDIIQFSNHLSYQGDIKPLREPSNSSLFPHVVPYRVEGGRRGDGKVNQEEAITIASLIAAACEDPAYERQSLGVISLLGDEQSLHIDSLLRRHLTASDYEDRRIVCGNSAQFQGDERDVVFLSMVDSPRSGPLTLSDRPETQQRYNVAASRARNQMWVVYSLNHEVDLKPGDLRRRLIEHALDPHAITREIEQMQSRTESPFEQRVLEWLVRAGYRVQPQWPVGRYRIDLVVEDGGQVAEGRNRRVAVECDGDRFHPPEKLAEDMERQAILERLGWRFIRIRGSAFFRDPDRAMASVIAKLEDWGIHPQGQEPVTVEVMPDQFSLKDALIRRAAELRADWLRQDSDDSRGPLVQDPLREPPEDSVRVPEKVHSDGNLALKSEEGELESVTAEKHLGVTEAPGSSGRSSSELSVESPTSAPPQPNLVADPIQQLPMVSTSIESPSVMEHDDFQLVSEKMSTSGATTTRQRILNLLQRRPSLKAAEIARELRLERSDVNHELYGALKSNVEQAANYRWSLRNSPTSRRSGHSGGVPNETIRPDSKDFTDLATQELRSRSTLNIDSDASLPDSAELTEEVSAPVLPELEIGDNQPRQVGTTEERSSFVTDNESVRLSDEKAHRLAQEFLTANVDRPVVLYEEQWFRWVRGNWQRAYQDDLFGLVAEFLNGHPQVRQLTPEIVEQVIRESRGMAVVPDGMSRPV